MIPQTGDFDKLIHKAQKLQAIAAELRPFLELVRQLDGKDFTVPPDRLIRAHEAAQKQLGVRLAGKQVSSTLSLIP